MVNRMQSQKDNNFFNKKVFKPIKGGGQAAKHGLQSEGLSNEMDFSTFVAKSNASTKNYETVAREKPVAP